MNPGAFVSVKDSFNFLNKPISDAFKFPISSIKNPIRRLLHQITNIPSITFPIKYEETRLTTPSPESFCRYHFIRIYDKLTPLLLQTRNSLISETGSKQSFIKILLHPTLKTKSGHSFKLLVDLPLGKVVHSLYLNTRIFPNECT